MDVRSERIKLVMSVSRAPKTSSSSICKWANGNCMYGEDYMYLHSWSDDILTRLHEDNPKPIRFVWWTTPLNDFVKINCYGDFSTHDGSKASIGGVVRDWRVHLSSASPVY
ncbi:hypothetical protein VNO78_03341 [Psophocarpus tetragonolobus]|uniref:Uncharacterized protein n=1 Tax=Psophocarpus tetragonolobus TaxID=3891 RepID=A0AAN9T432_PSOTE